MSDQMVSSRHVLDAEMELRRIGSSRALEQLEAVEGDLASYLMETLTLIHGQIVDLGSPSRPTQRVYRRVQALTLVLIASMRRAHYELWRSTDGEPVVRAFDAGDAPVDDADPRGGFDAVDPLTDDDEGQAVA